MDPTSISSDDITRVRMFVYSKNVVVNDNSPPTPKPHPTTNIRRSPTRQWPPPDDGGHSAPAGRRESPPYMDLPAA